MLYSGQYLWNAGIFSYHLNVLKSAFETHALKVFSPVEQVFAHGADGSGVSPPRCRNLGQYKNDFIVSGREGKGRWFASSVLTRRLERSRVKCIVVKLEGTAKVTISGQKRRLCENQSIYFLVGAKHGLENESDAPVALIEMQTGGHLGEDKIVLYDDIYTRE